MFGGDDPFGFNMFGHMHRQMREMDQMMDAMVNPFGMTRQMPMHPMLQNRIQQRSDDEEMGVAMPMMHPFGNFGGIFGNMNNLQQRAMSDPDSHVFVQSTTITFDPHGRQRVVTNSTRKAGDVREDRRRIRDHETDEMEIGHAIGNRKHYIEKKRDKDGRVRSQQRFVNMDEADAADFDKEFHSRARDNFGGRYNQNSGHASLTDGSPGSSRHSRRSTQSVHEPNAPIVTLPEEEEDPRDTRESSRSHTGPIIREISDEEAASHIPKRRRGFF